MTYILTKKTNGEAVFRKKFRTVKFAEDYLKEHFPDWEKTLNLEIVYC